jgi:hypothetical protein
MTDNNSHPTPLRLLSFRLLQQRYGAIWAVYSTWGFTKKCYAHPIGPTHRLGRWISRNRFDQLHRYFTIRDSSINPPNDDEGFWWHLEPVASLIRLAFQQNWEPGSHLAIDESMTPFRGNSSHTEDEEQTY